MKIEKFNESDILCNKELNHILGGAVYGCATAGGTHSTGYVYSADSKEVTTDTNGNVTGTKYIYHVLENAGGSDNSPYKTNCNCK